MSLTHSNRFSQPVSPSASALGALPLSGGILTGGISWNNVLVAGLRLNNLTTVQRDAIASPGEGALIHNTTTGRVNYYRSGAWSDGWVRLGGDTMTGPLEIQNGAAQQFARVYGTYDTAGANYRRATLTMTTAGNMQLRAEGLGTGVAGNTFDLFLNGTSYLQLTAAGTATLVGGLQIGQASTFQFAGWTRIKSAADGVLTITNQAVTDFGRLQLGGTTNAFPSLKRSGAGIDVRLADDSGYAFIRGKLQTDNAYAAGAVVPTGTVTIYDSTGTAYRIPCLV